MDFIKKYTSHEEYEVNKTPNVSLCIEDNETKHLHYTKKKFDDEYLTFEALESGTFTLTIGSGVTTGDVTSVSYSLDNGETWTTTNNIQGQRVVITTPTVNAGDEVLWKGNANRMANNTDTNRASRFSSTANFNARGNVMSLLYGDEFKDKNSLSGKVCCFYYLFNNNIKLINGKNISLPATILAEFCYYYMFYGCTSLTTAPELPATTLASWCYGVMFGGCTSLTVAPELPATTLAGSCYVSMFYACTSLTVAPELPATTLAGSCYQSMFYNCTSLTVAPELSATTLASSCYSSMFYGCTSLTTAPELPATTLASNCYQSMFNGCTSLTVAPELPATTLASYCYQQMFYGCTSLTVAPELPATTLTEGCYQSMFNGCTSLTTAPELPATTLASNCYQSMFNGCTSLTTAPELPATTLTQYCYRYMFAACTSLTTAPKLPATTLAQSCYYYMFQGCTSLTTAPELPATILAQDCYAYMFRDCTNLNSITCLATDISAYQCTINWVNGVAASGTFIKHPSMTGWTSGVNGIPEGWEKTDFVTSENYLTFDILSSGTIVWKASTTATTVATISYSINGGEWTDITSSTAGTSFNVSDGDKVRFKGNNARYSTASNYNTFSGSTASFNLEGNIMSLIDDTIFDYKTTLDTGYTFNSLFRNTNVNNAENLILPAETLTTQCYQNMFNGCTSLTTAPELPATTLAWGCYQNMFNGCTNLTTTPELPATTLANYCYFYMFYGCISLTVAPELPATTLADHCYAYMFYGCTSLTVAPELPATTLTNSCYLSMFDGCRSLVAAPELPAITLTTQCYKATFQGCTSLTTAPELPATTLASSCYEQMFRGCTSLTVAPELPSTTLADDCYQQMFYGCTSLTTAPALPATTLEYRCYYVMFYDCTSLNSITCLATDISAANCTASWVKGVASNGTFIKADGMNDWTIGSNGIPTNWTVEDFYATKYFTTIARENGTISFNIRFDMGTDMIQSISYSTDNGETWTTTQNQNNKSENIVITVNVKNGDKVMWKGDAEQLGCWSSNEDVDDMVGSFFSSTCEFDAQGNVMSLLYGDDFKGESTIENGYAFACLFHDFDGENACEVVNTKNLSLPATTLANQCYGRMFKGCTSLTVAPELSATTLVGGCYYEMFSNCTSLTIAPELPATTLAQYCYQYMFQGCTSLTTVPQLTTTTLAYYCYMGMFQGCTNLTTAPNLPATTLAEGCYEGMFEGCASLTTAPELPATTLAQYSYHGMFSNCTSLNSITCLATDISASFCTNGWVTGVASSGTFTKAPSMTGWTTGVNGIPTNWNVEDYNTHDGALMTMYVDDFKQFDFIDDQVDDPEGNGCNLYLYSGTLTRSGNTYYSWILSGASGQEVPYVYLLTTTNDYNTLNSQSLENNKSNRFTSFVERCSSDAPPITYESRYDKDLYLVKMYRNGTQIGMWVDDYEFGPSLIAKEINDPIGYGLDTYKYYGDTITRNGTTYYVWEMSEECTWNSNVSRLLTTTVDFNTLYGQSLDDDYNNTFTSLVGRFDEDIEDEYVDSGGNQLYLVKVIEGSPATMRIWVDDFPLSLQQDYDEEHQRLLTKTVNDPDTYSNKYVYTNSTVQMNGSTYYVWEYDSDTDAPYSYLLTTTADVSTLYNQSLDNDLTNQFTAYVGRCSSDLDEIYADDSVVMKMYLVNAITENGTPVIYVDDFADTFKEYSLGHLEYEANPYDFKGNTITYNGNTYYLWEMNTELGAGGQENVPYFATTTVDFDTLYSQSIEDDADNRFTSAIGMFDDSEEMYTAQGTLQDGTDRHYLLKVQRL